MMTRLLGLPPSGRTDYKRLMKLCAREDDGSGLYGPAHMRHLRLGREPVPRLAGARPPIVLLRSLRRRSGKSTIAANLATALAFKGYRVLCVDADPQADLGSYLGAVPPGALLELHFGTLLSKFLQHGRAVDCARVRVPVFDDGMLDLLPGSIDLLGVDAMLAVRDSAAGIVPRFLDAHDDFLAHYDVVVVDGPPGIGRLQRGLTECASLVLAPVMPDQASLGAAATLTAEVARIEHARVAATNLVALVNGASPNDIGQAQHLVALARTLTPWSVASVMLPWSCSLDNGCVDAPGTSRASLVETQPFGDIALAFLTLAGQVMANTLALPCDSA